MSEHEPERNRTPRPRAEVVHRPHLLGLRGAGQGDPAPARRRPRHGRRPSARSSSPRRPWWRCKGGRSARRQRKFFPGYILVEMEMSDEAWHVVKNTPKVTGFVGTGQEADAALRGRSRPDPRAGGARQGEAEAQVRVREGRSRCKIADGPSTTSRAWSTRSTSIATRSRSWSRSSAGNPGRAGFLCRWRSS